MIIGTGLDIIEISRIIAAVKNPRFVSRVFTSGEWEQARKANYRLAGFFAAKEALLKAMGTGLSQFSWLEMEVDHDPLGAPRFILSGKVDVFLKDKAVNQLHLSISHCREYAVAQVILER